MVYLYRKLANEIKSQIESGKLQPGDQIPSGRELAQREHMSTATVLKSIALLVTEGWLTTGPNGTSVADRRATEPREAAEDVLVTIAYARPAPSWMRQELAEMRQELAETRQMLEKILQLLKGAR